MALDGDRVIHLDRVLERQQLHSAASKVRPVFGRVRSQSLRGPALNRPGGDRLRTLQQIIENAYGYTRAEGAKLYRRAPSAGGLYPTEVVCVVLIAARWTALTYDFHRRVFRELLDSEPATIATACAVTADQAVIVVTSTLWRTLQRYGFRGYRYCLIDAGIVMGTIAQVCRAEQRSLTHLDNRALTQIDDWLALPSSEITACAAIIDCAGARSTEVGHRDAPLLPRAPDTAWQQSPMLAAELERTIRLDRAMRVAEAPDRALVSAGGASEDRAELQHLIDTRRSARGLRRGELDAQACGWLPRALDAIVSQWPARHRDSIALTLAVRADRPLLRAMRRTASRIDVTAVDDLPDRALTALFGGQALMAEADLFFVAGLRGDVAEDAIAVFRSSLLQIGMLTSTVQLLAVQSGIAHTIVGGFDDAALAAMSGHTITPLVAIAFGTAATHSTKNDTPRRQS
ncbi:hypothetical protein [Nocardia fluminea]|uniref:hypothetical protein n=1 Tax=Nocardia fluminea TaxID=134984 RepID=UPI00343210F7